MNTPEIVSAVAGGSLIGSVAIAAAAVRRAVRGGYTVTLNGPALSFKPPPKAAAESLPAPAAAEPPAAPSQGLAAA